MYLVFSTSLHPDSRSRVLARSAVEQFEHRNAQVNYVDLMELPLPNCDGYKCYEQPQVVELAERIKQARAALIAAPVYNYDLSATAKNIIELTGSAWSEKVVGFLCAAGGQGSYMAPMGMANSLMLDFRCLILPQFVYANEDDFRGNEIDSPDIKQRIENLVERTIRLAQLAD